MTQDNKIWHTPDEQPAFYPVQLIAELENGMLYYFECNSPESWFYMLDEIESAVMCPIEQWAYLQNFIASSKALDVAIDALKELVDSHVQGPSDAIKLWASVVAETAINKVNEIMKSLQ